MERQVRFTAGTVVLAGLGLGLLHPARQLLCAGIAGGLVFSALTNTCGMATLSAKLPHNRTRATDLDTTLAALTAADPTGAGSSGERRRSLKSPHAVGPRGAP